MTDAFIAFVRHEEELLLLRRSKSDSDSPGLWDGVYGIGDSEEDVLNRVAECTGIPLEDLNKLFQFHYNHYDKLIQNIPLCHLLFLT